MGASAEVDELTLPVEGHARHVGRQRLQDLDLERLVVLAVVADRVRPGPLLADDRVVGLGQVPHALLEAPEVLLGEGRLAAEVVIEAVVDGGPDGELDAREELGDRLGQEVRRGVAKRGQGLGHAIVLPRPCQVRVCLVRHSLRRISLRTVPVFKKKTSRRSPFVMLSESPHLGHSRRTSGHPSRDVMRGRDGRFRTADLLCVRQALSH